MVFQAAMCTLRLNAMYTQALVATKEQAKREHEYSAQQRQLHETTVNSLKKALQEESNIAKRLIENLENHKKLLREADKLAGELKKHVEESVKQQLAKQAQVH